MCTPFAHPFIEFKDHKQRWMDCLLTEHVFVKEEDLFPGGYHSRSRTATVNEEHNGSSRIICEHCGSFKVINGHIWDESAGPYKVITLHKGPDSRMYGYWADKHHRLNRKHHAQHTKKP